MWKHGLKHGFGTYDLESVGLRYEGFWVNVRTLRLTELMVRTRNMGRDGSCIQMGQIFEGSLRRTSQFKMRSRNQRSGGGLWILIWGRRHHIIILARDLRHCLPRRRRRAQQQKAAGKRNTREANRLWRRSEGGSRAERVRYHHICRIRPCTDDIAICMNSKSCTRSLNSEYEPLTSGR
jgi:hypothetical protein